MNDNRLPQALTPRAGRGRVLRVKEGYNPNSSSLGSIVFIIPAALVAVPVLLATVASLIESRFAGGSSARQPEQQPVQEEGTP